MQDATYEDLKKDSLVFCQVPESTISTTLRKFYYRHNVSTAGVSLFPLSAFARAWHINNEINSAWYFSRLKLSTKANEAILFEEEKSKLWFVGCALFFFKHTHDKQERYLAFVKVADEQLVMSHTKTIPVATVGQDTLYFGRRNMMTTPSPSSKYMVIEVEEITTVVGLVQCPGVEGRYKAVSPKLLYDNDWSQNVGSLERNKFYF